MATTAPTAPVLEDVVLEEKLLDLHLEGVPFGREGWRADLQKRLAAEWGGKPAVDQSVAVSVRFVYPKRRGKVFPVSGHTGVKDIDNLCKPVIDSLKRVVLQNDMRVVALSAVKLYGAKPEVGLRVRVYRAAAAR